MWYESILNIYIMSKDYKIVLAGDFATGRTSFVTKFTAAKQGKSKVGESPAEG